jgi:Tfp pilus assembly protein PilW
LKLRPSLLASDSGFTITELLVVSFLGLLMLALTLSATMSNRQLYRYDLVRTRINQNLRSALDIIGIDVREAGENLPSTFPAVEIIDGTAGAPDELIVRRNLVDEVFNVCVQIASGSGNTDVIVADDTLTVPGCDTTSNLTALTNWSAYRLAEGGTVKGYVYDRVNHVGEFFDLVDEQNNGSNFRIVRAAGNWTNTYPVGASSIYILEEWRYRLQNGVLQIVTDQDTANPLDVVTDLTDFQVLATMQDTTTMNSFAVTDDWTEIATLQILLTGQDTIKGEVFSRTVSARFFPRNILSN